MLYRVLQNPYTWDRMPWGSHLGFMGNHAVFSPAACRNRQNVNLYNFFRHIYDDDHLVVRWGVNCQCVRDACVMTPVRCASLTVCL